MFCYRIQYLLKIMRKTHFHYRKKMSSECRSDILSTLLNEVTGTEEAIKIRQDYCRLDDCIKSLALPCNSKHYFTGSKSEGLNLKGSDEDYMIDITDAISIQVVQSLDTPKRNTPLQSILFMYEIYPPWICTLTL